MRNRKETAWRKNRKFGDVHGGRVRRRMTDGIFKREHSLKRPGPHQETPILVEDNPSRDFFFPLTGAEALEKVKALPVHHTAGLTHLWLRRAKKSEFEAGELPFAEFICGSGVRVVVLYPWPNDMMLFFGTKRPPEGTIRFYSRWSKLTQHEGKHVFRFTERSLQAFYTNFLIRHEIGHHIDQYSRRWSKANAKEVEEFADQYAYRRTSVETLVFDAEDDA